MFRVINEYLTKVKLKTNDETRNKIAIYLDECEDIKKYVITVNFNQYIVDIKIKDFTIEKAEKIFAGFNINVSYSYSSLYVRFNEGSCVRYRYVTCSENKDAFYCDIVLGK